MTHDALAFFIELALKSTAVAGFALLFVTGFRRLAAAEKHLVLGAALAALLLLPLASVLLPKTPLPLRVVGADFTRRLASAIDLPEAIQPSAGVAVSKTVQPQRVAATPIPERGAISASSSSEGPSVAWLFVIVYLAVAALLLGSFLVRAWRVTRLVRSLDAVPASSTRRLAGRLVRELGMRRRVRLLQSPSDKTPWAWGLARGVIVLPERFDTWPAEAQRNAIVHELAHIRRFDLPTTVLGHVCCACIGFSRSAGGWSGG